MKNRKTEQSTARPKSSARTSLKTRVGLCAAALVVTAVSVLVGSSMFSTQRAPSTFDYLVGQTLIDKPWIALQLGDSIRGGKFPLSFEVPYAGLKMKSNVHYGLHESSQAQMMKLLSQYKPDYGAFVAIDAKTGRILSMASFSAVDPEHENLALRATFPAASVFKIVTASAVLDMNKALPETVMQFNGANHTLYKKNVEDTKVNRWTRHMTMREAFARSVNVVFSKLGLFYVGPERLRNYAERFFFNHQIPSDFPIQTGMAKFSDDDRWSIATAASGFTRDNTMSPLQGALIAAAVANDGVMMEPYLVESLTDDSGGTTYQAVPKMASIVVEPQSAEKLRELFNETVKSGTSRKWFRKTVRGPLYDDVEFGGKTGSLTGLNPSGKVDWFVGYARYRNQRIAVAALTVNEKKWKVKSSALANMFFTQYLGELKHADQAIARHTANE
jgi:peptidoglycan glycosyltransferase